MQIQEICHDLAALILQNYLVQEDYNYSQITAASESGLNICFMLKRSVWSYFQLRKYFHVPLENLDKSSYQPEVIQKQISLQLLLPEIFDRKVQQSRPAIHCFFNNSPELSC